MRVTDDALNPLTSLPPTGKLLGLDLGTKTIGVAISDGMRYSATPLETIKRLKFTQDAIRLVKIQGFSIEEASARTGQSVSLVKVNIHRGLAKLVTIVQGQAHVE